MGKKLRQLFLDGEEFQPTLEVNQEGSWLDIKFDVTGIKDNEIDQVLNSLLRKDRFIRLKTERSCPLIQRPSSKQVR